MEQNEQRPAPSQAEMKQEDARVEQAREAFIAGAKARFDARTRAATEATQRLGLQNEAMMDVFSVMYGDGNPIAPREERVPQPEEK